MVEYATIEVTKIAIDEIKYSKSTIGDRFTDGTRISDVIRYVLRGQGTNEYLRVLRVVQRSDGDVMTIDNRQLLVWKTSGHLGYLPSNEVRCLVIDYRIPTWQRTTRDDGRTVKIVTFPNDKVLPFEPLPFEPESDDALTDTDDEDPIWHLSWDQWLKHEHLDWNQTTTVPSSSFAAQNMTPDEYQRQTRILAEHLETMKENYDLVQQCLDACGRDAPALFDQLFDRPTDDPDWKERRNRYQL